MFHLRTLIMTAILAAGSIAAYAQPAELTVDLAQPAGSTNTVSVPRGDVHVTIINKANAFYQVTAIKSNVVVAALSTSVFSTPKPAAGTPSPGPADPCSQPEAAFDGRFEAVTEESKIPAALAEARAIAAACTPPMTDRLNAQIKLRTEQSLRTVTLGEGEELTVTVDRGTGKDQKEWKLVATTGAAGEWRVSYGFNFLQAKDDNFYLAPTTDNPQKFTITRANRRDRLAFAPSVFFSFLTNAEQRRAWAIGPVAGLGFDLSDPVVFGGGSVTFRQNVSFNLGVVFHKERRLAGKYKGDGTSVVGENLTDDQLYTKTYVPRLFIGIGFRFGDNPFKSNSSTDKGASK